ncbi:hypothetical protein BD309DRAFT_972652 [Dichomitus squalens]|uniref:Uncharacterized protein n=1 Tax=Dichomitus squalens TaxID=114155 RepID=A0A4Q9PVT2_9APHY|nr:hypothetical protein BD309DRAFT_972652 [Dichomitus squalens]TBU58566.1 hypothetical protein BD310DRAFT_851022 [Dichomitus squalens]
MRDVPLDRASFVSLWVETLFYGAYTILFAICIYILFYKKGKNVPLNKPMIATTIALFTMSTIHIILDCVRGLQAFFNPSMSPLEYYAQIWDPLSIFKQALYATNNIVADGLVVYRCYIVWGHRLSIVVPSIIMLIATSVCGYLAVYNFSQVHPGDNVFASNIAEWGTALFSLSLATNLIVTTLIASRIWWIGRQASSTLGRRHAVKYTNAMAIIIESGAIYSASLMTLLILYCQQTNAQYIVYDALAQIMGIVPTLIVVRVGLGVSTQDITTYGTTGRLGNTQSSGRTFALPMRFRQNTDMEATTYELESRVTTTTLDKLSELEHGRSK